MTAYPQPTNGVVKKPTKNQNVWCLVQLKVEHRPAVVNVLLEPDFSALTWANFYLKSVKFLFLLSIDRTPIYSIGY